MMYFHTKQQEGFSLVETLVAISILLIVIVGPMTISARTAKSSSYATEKIQAFFLAQEGLEIAQKLRDDLELSPGPNRWGNFAGSNLVTTFYPNCFAGAGCGLEWSTVSGVATVVPCTGSCLLYLNSSSDDRSKFTYLPSGAVATPFTRRIYFETGGTTGLVQSREVRVRSVVTWRTGSIVADQKVELTTNLLNINAQP